MITLEEFSTKVWLRGDPTELDDITERLRFHPPEYWRSPKYQLWKGTEGREGWDGWTTLVRRVGQDVAWIQRGHQERLTTAAAALSIEINWKTQRKPFAGLTIDDVPADLIQTLTLDLDQRTCVLELLSNTFGTVEIPTSGGKTALLFAAALLIRRRYPNARFLYVTPSERLVKQVVTEAGKLAPLLRVSQFGGGVKSETGKDLVIATLATLNRNHPRLIESGWYKTFTGLIFDECHHASAPKTKKLISEIPALFRFGASATLKDKSKKDIMRSLDIEGAFGPARHRSTMAPLIEIGRVAKPYLYLVDQQDWTDKFEALPYNVSKNTSAWCLLPDLGWVKGTYAGPVYQRDLDDRLVRDGGERKTYAGWKKACAVLHPECIFKGDTADGSAVADGEVVGEWGGSKGAVGEPVVFPNRHTILINGEEHEVESKWCLLHRQHDEGVIRFKQRNQFVVEWVQHFVAQGWPTLVIATRSLHVLILEALLARVGLTEVRTLMGEDSSKKRDETFAWLIAAPGRVLISPLVKEGVSIPELKAGVIADYIGTADVAHQMLGRFIRHKPAGGNEAHVVLFIDRQTTAMRRGSLGLIKELEKTRGFNFYWPCGGPSAVGPLFEAASFD